MKMSKFETLHADMYRIPERRCQVCGKQFYTEEKHIRHMNRFHPDLWAEFSGGRPLEFFIPPREVQHREKKFVCTVCSKTYSHETGLLKHLVTHPESHDLRTRLWSCCVCEKVFTKESYLERHLEMKLDPEHGKALSEYKKRNGIKEVGRVNVNMLLPPATSSALVSSSSSSTDKEGGSSTNGELPSTSTQVMAASSTARTPPDGAGGMRSPPPPPLATSGSSSSSTSATSSALGPPAAPPAQHAADLSVGGSGGMAGTRSPILSPPTPSCSLAAADSTVPSPFSPPPPTTSAIGSMIAPSTSSSTSSLMSQRSPTLTRPLSHPSPLLNRSFSESCLSSPHPLFGPAMSSAMSQAAAAAAMDALHGPMSPPPQGHPAHVNHVAPPVGVGNTYAQGFRHNPLHGAMSPHHPGAYGAPSSGITGQHPAHWGATHNPVSNLHHQANPLHNAAANLGNHNLAPLRFGHLPFPTRPRDYGPPRPGDQEDVVSALQSLADSIHPSS